MRRTATATIRRRSASPLSSLPKRIADFIEPMDCAPVTKLADGPGWLFEIKLDGYRAVGVKCDLGVNLFSRRHKLFNHQYPYLVEALNELPKGTVLDGEMSLSMNQADRISICSKSRTDTISSCIFSWIREASSEPY